MFKVELPNCELGGFTGLLEILHGRESLAIISQLVGFLCGQSFSPVF